MNQQYLHITYGPHCWNHGSEEISQCSDLELHNNGEPVRPSGGAAGRCERRWRASRLAPHGMSRLLAEISG